MNLETVRVRMVGLGLAATSHFKGYDSHPAAEVVAVCDLSQGRAETFAQERGIDSIYVSFEKMLAEADVQIVDLATPTFLHADMTRMAAEAGKHVHCEKPFCRSVGEGLSGRCEQQCEAGDGRNLRVSCFSHEGPRIDRGR